MGVFSIMENNLILMSVMFIVAWFTGAQTDLDNEHRRQLTKLANTDLLTGLYNYGYFQEKIVEHVQHASGIRPLSLLVMDIDYFKHYNDIFGHQAGDALLAAVADLLTAKINNHGFVARYGGDEFVAVLDNTGGEEALRLADEISESVRNLHFRGEEYQPAGQLTISCGIAVYPNHAHNAKDLFKYADQALYRAKSLNRNKAELYYSVFDNLDLGGDEKELLNSIRTLISIIDAKDRYTYGHSERVTSHAIALARKIGLPQDQINLLSYAAFLHDIGKIEIDRIVLNKAGPLSEGEWKLLKQHPQWGGDIVKAVDHLRPIVSVIRHHHENYDGSGYPAGLKGVEIPLLARIIRVVDSYDAMISHRPYKKSMSIPAAIEELRTYAGSQFDPELVKCFTDIIYGEIGGMDMEPAIPATPVLT